MLRRKVKERVFSQSGSSRDGWENEQELQTYSPKKEPLASDELEGSLTGAIQRDAGGWNESEREMFETQILLLQDQLTAAYVQIQDLGDQMAEFESEKSDLKEKLSAETQKYQTMKKLVHKLQDELGEHSTPQASSSQPVTDQTSASSLSKGGGEDGSKGSEGPAGRGGSGKKEKSSMQGYWSRFYEYLLETFYKLSDLMEESPEGPIQEEEEPPLALKALRDNIKRVKRDLDPYYDMAMWVKGVLYWKRPFESFIIFLLCLYSIWTGWLLPLLLFLAVGKLTFTYLEVLGLSERFGIATKQSTQPDSDQSSALSTVNLVKLVGQKIQNITAMVADVIEKFNNLCYWRYPEATSWVYKRMWVVLILSIFMPNMYLLSFIGMGLTFKLFIINTIYRKYPRVQAKYDTIARLWAALPTDAQLQRRQALLQADLKNHIDACHEQAVSATGNLKLTDTWDIPDIPNEILAFCERFSFGTEERPQTDWENGRRCTLFDKDHPLKNMKHGRLYLTANYLCYEQSAKQKDPESRFSIAIREISYAIKAKPLAVLPGSGMSIEVGVKGRSRPFLFGAILNRDQALQAILDQALIAGCDWATGVPTPGSPAADETANSP